MSTTINDLQSRMPGGNSQALAPAQLSSISTEEARAVAQVQAGMTIGKRFPRDEQEALTKTLRTCAVVEFAEGAEYVYKRGGTSVRGPTIRLLEEVSRHWKNIEWSVMEVTRDESAGQSLAQAYAVDLENNTWSRRQFIVPHRRDVQEGSKDLKSDRDIYEMVANMGSRRVRACLEGLIPSYVIDACVEACRNTLLKRDKEKPLATRIATLIDSFKPLGVTETQISKWLKGRPVAEMREVEYQDLRAIGRSIKEGMARIDEHFEPATVSDSMAAKRGAAAGTQPKPQPPAGDGGGAAGAGASAQKSAQTAGAAAVAEGVSPAADESVGGTERPDPAGAAQPSGGDSGGAGHTQATLLAEIASAKTIDRLNSIGNLLVGAKLTKDETKAVRLASGKRAQAIQAEQRAKPADTGGAPQQESMIPE